MKTWAMPLIIPRIGISWLYPIFPGASVTISSWQQEEAGSGGIPAGGQKIDITPLLQVGYGEAIDLVRQQNQGIDVTETELDLPYGSRGILFIFPVEDGVPEIRQMLTSVNGHNAAVQRAGGHFDFL